MISSTAPRHSLRRYLRHIRRVAPLALGDTLIILAAYGASYSVRATAAPNFEPGLSFFLFIIPVTLLSLYLFGVYNRLWYQTSGHDVTVIVKGMAVATVIIFVADYLITPRPLPLSVVLVGNALTLTGVVAVRYRSRLLSSMVITRHNQPVTRVLIVGAGEAGQTTALRLKHRFSNGHSGYAVVGFVDDDPAKQNMYVEGCRVLGDRRAIPRLADAYNIDLIVVALHNVSGHDFRDILNYCERTHARIKTVPDVLALLSSTQTGPLLRDILPEDLLGRQTVSWFKAVDVRPVSHKVILVTGAAGSIGSELCRQLLSYDPVRLILLDNNESGLYDLMTELESKADPAKLCPVLADITVLPAIRRVFEQYRPQVVFHSAAYKHVPMLELHPRESVRVNIGGTRQVAELARDYGVERFLLISTDKAVQPNGVMGASKRVCELIMHLMARQGNTLFTSVRFGNVLGSRGSVVNKFTWQIEAGGPVTITHEEMARYFMTIPEAVNLVIHAACLTKGNDMFMLQMGEEVRIMELAERMIRLRGLRPHDDIPLQVTGIRPGEKLHEELRSGSETAVPTVHPDIIELTSDQRRDLDGLVAHLDALLRDGLDSERDALSQLLDVINGSR